MRLPDIELSVEIDAPIDRVWAVMTDLERYSEWNPYLVSVTDIRGALGVGCRFHVETRWHDGGGSSAVERITRFEAPAPGPDGARIAALEYVFEGLPAKLGMVRERRVQTLAELSHGRVRYATLESFSGWAARMVPIERVRSGLERHAAALVTRATSTA